MDVKRLAQLVDLLEQFANDHELELPCEDGEVLVQARHIITRVARTSNGMTLQDFYRLKQSTKSEVATTVH